MRRRISRLRLFANCALALTTLGLPAASASADEGMWPYNMIPKDEIQAKHGVVLDDKLLQRAQLSSVRFNNGGSGSFVSKDALVMTNQHVARDCLQKLTTDKRNIIIDGFLATSKDQELKCPDLELNQTRSILDVTDKVQAAAAALGKGATAKAQNDARKKAMGELEKACKGDDPDKRCDVVTLYSGGAYHLYTYRKFTDVRLVWAPENDAKHFGGEKDNFNFPRMSLDATFFRVYVGQKPLDTSYFHLPFAKTPVAEGDVVLVSGHPGSTGRFSTLGKLRFLRDTVYPLLKDALARQTDAYHAFTKRGPDQRRIALAPWLRASNGKKAITGYLNGLNDDALMAAYEKRLTDMQAQLQGNADVAADDKKAMLNAFGALDAAYDSLKTRYAAYAVTEGYLGPHRSPLVGIARHLVRLADELPKDSGQRMREYRDSNLQSLEMKLFSEAPVHVAFEKERLALALTMMQEHLGQDDATMKALLDGKSPSARANELFDGTKLLDVDVRKQLHKGGKAAVDASTDPLIVFAKALDARARQERTFFEENLEAKERQFAPDVARAWAVGLGRSVYPDATFTLRLSVGVAKSYVDGKKVHWHTSVGDVYRQNKRSRNAEPYVLPQSFHAAIGNVDFSVPYNFVSTNDIIGGNSGSPAFNTQGEVVGLIFDGNLPQLSNRFLYRDDKERSVSVHAHGMVHVLKNVYGAHDLVRELGF